MIASQWWAGVRRLLRTHRRALRLLDTTSVCMVLLACVARPQPAVRPDLGVKPEVVAEETVYQYHPANNGADPLWAYGSTVIARWQDQVAISGLETLADVPPYNNVRCVVYQRREAGWTLAWSDDRLTREPCPVGVFQDGRLILSTNPTLGSGPEPSGGPAQPTLLEFSFENLADPQPSLPAWRTDAPFNQHSYRGLGVDGALSEVLLLNINDSIGQEWSFRDSTGEWIAQGQLSFPYDAASRLLYRLCYPQVALANRQAYVMAISDIEEPVTEYLQYKKAQGSSAFIYVFRKLYYAWTPDIASTPFSAWVELADEEATAGSVHNEDIWMDSDGSAHMLWIESPVEQQLRDAFFPDVKLATDLVHAVVRDGVIVSREVLLHWQEGEPGERVQWARFHGTCNGDLYVLYASRPLGSGASSAGALQNRLARLLPEGGMSGSAAVPLAQPLARFMPASERSGAKCSQRIDMVGSTEQGVIRYARISLIGGGSTR